MNRLRSSSCLIAAVMLAWTLVGHAQDDDPLPATLVPSTSEADPDHVFDIYISGGEASYVLENLKAETFFGIRCLAGSYANPDVPWLHGSVIRIPTDKIMLIAEYESIEDYARRLKTVENVRMTDVTH